MAPDSLAQNPAYQETAKRLERADAAVRQVDLTAFPVSQRVLKRVIIQDLGLTGLNLNLPHRKTWSLTSVRAQQLLEPDELGLADFSTLPAKIQLLARPEEDELERFSEQDLCLRYWKLLFHIRVHRAMDDAFESGQLTTALVRKYIEELGQVEFYEVQAMLQRERMLPPDHTRNTVFTEFAAVYLETLCFEPGWMNACFPGLKGRTLPREMLGRYINIQGLLDETRIEGAPTLADRQRVTETTATEPPVREESRRYQGPQNYHHLGEKARRSSVKGNNARAARLWLQAAHYSPSLLAGDATLHARREIETLTRRLQAALRFDDAEAKAWTETLVALLGAARPGFWNADARLLYDLQKVAIDHEREVFVVDSFKWLRSFGRRPLRHRLPYQREVLMCRHLKSANRRLIVSRLSGHMRDVLGKLLHHAAEAAETQLRNRLRPVVDQALAEVDLQPANIPEQVSRAKIIEECLDVVAERGFLNLGHLRDAISRNQLKFKDLTPHDFVTGGPLLQLDRKLDTRLDGVYQRGEFYLRWLQRLSSATFGTWPGRWLTLFVMVPFGGAYIVLAGLDHLIELLVKVFLPGLPHLRLMPRDNPAQVYTVLGGVGLFFLSLIHSPTLRKTVSRGLLSFWSVAKGLLFDLPARLLRQPAVKHFLRSRPIVTFRRHLLFPLFVTAIVFPFLRSSLDVAATNPWTVASCIFLVSMVLLNSRIGRSVEATTADFFEWTWYTVRVRIFVALFEGIMDFFKRVMEWIERLLYAVDEWLRFKSGESQATLVVKAILGLFWGLVAYVIRFCVTLLIEPQINPIKHFPVVTVSHKIILPMQPALAKQLIPALGRAYGEALAGAIIFAVPGIFGFLVWELKENWRLYAANRSPSLRPNLVGSHGETVVRLLRPGFHSGTVPKAYARLRKAHRRADDGQRAAMARTHETLHHAEQSFRHFIERDLIRLIEIAGLFEPGELSVGHITVTANTLHWELTWKSYPDAPVRVMYAEQSGYLVAGIDSAGWLDMIGPERRRLCGSVIAGIYAFSGVDIVREHVTSALHHKFHAYDIADNGLVVWPEPNFEVELVYPFGDSRTLSPRPIRTAEKYQLPRLDADDVFFVRTPILWSDWTAFWQTETSATPASPVPESHGIPIVLGKPR